MARVVEICGISGVGKSTIFQKLMYKWRRDYKWVPATLLFPHKFGLISKLLFKIRWDFIYSRAEGNIDDNAMKEFGERFILQYPEYLNTCWKNFYISFSENINGKDLRFDKAKYLNISLQRFQYLKENNNSQIAILDEGLLHRIANGLYKRQDPEEEKEEIKHLINTAPLPDAVVYIETDLDLIADRLYKRKKVISSHKSLSKEELKYYSSLSLQRMLTMIKAVESTHVPLLYINSKSDAEANANEIIRFVESL